MMKFGIKVGMRATRGGMRGQTPGQAPLTLKLFIFAVKPRIRAVHHMARSRSLSFWELSHVSRSWKEKRIKGEAHSAASKRIER